MLTREERALIYEEAYLPEHLVDYVEAVSGSEPHLHDGHLCFFHRKHLIFIGYPLGAAAPDAAGAYESACLRFHPATTAIIAREIWLPPGAVEHRGEDSYYRLDLPLPSPPAEVSYMVRRAARELRVTTGTFGPEHRKLVKGFISGHSLGREQKQIFKRIPDYLARSSTARLLETRKGDSLAAFSVMDTGSAGYAFYVFNFRSPKVQVPGASDLLLMEMIRLAESEGKGAVNLGLGIHPGIRRFKEKWGGKPFLPYASALTQREARGLGRLADKL